MERVEEVKRKSGGKENRFGKRYGFEIKLRCVKLRLEEGFSVPLLCKEAGVSKSAIHHWVKAYQERGEAGLRDPGVFPKKAKKLPGAVRENNCAGGNAPLIAQKIAEKLHSQKQEKLL